MSETTRKTMIDYEFKPFVSIVIPLFNNRKNLARTLDSLISQTYSKNNYEIIVVDNGSSDNPRQITDKYPVLYIEEHQFLSSPYSARNRGIEIAKGEIIVLLDTTCAVVPEWLASGVESLGNNSDLVGGNVVFDIDESSSLGEIYDSLINIKMKDSVINRGVAKTTNLFVRKKVFDVVGAFPDGVRSGADVGWSRKAVQAGFKLVFSESAKALIQPRGFKPLLRKQYRVSKGQVKLWIDAGKFKKNFIKNGVLCFLPPNPITIRKMVEKTEKKYIRDKLGRLYLLAYVMRLVGGAGLFSGALLWITGRR